jgi:hypothetical protein
VEVGGDLGTEFVDAVADALGRDEDVHGEIEGKVAGFVKRCGRTVCAVRERGSGRVWEAGSLGYLIRRRDPICRTAGPDSADGTR